MLLKLTFFIVGLVILSNTYFVSDAQAWKPTPTPRCTPRPTPTPSPIPTPSSTPTPTETPQPTPTPPPPPPPPPPAGGPGSGGLSPAGAPSCPDAAPGSTQLLSVTSAGSGSVVLSWTKADGANNYTISYGTSSGNYSFGVPSTGNVTSFTIGGLNPTQTYCFAVRPYNSCQPGSLSNEICQLTRVAAVPQGQVLGITTLAAASSDKVQQQTALTILLGFLLIAYGANLKRASKSL
ncbi:fibronectin type III domain-containing protein [Candidatus Daviesbacteria bacterium]|nr:fibronectin type III domain-containing protein [Candidatus Daviesbacteria bacterium]